MRARKFMVKLHQEKLLGDFIDMVEAEAIEIAAREGVMIRLEKENRGRFITLVVRAVATGDEGDEVVLKRKFNGRTVKD